MTKQIKKLLIANRGEIAVRIQETAHEMGISTVAIHSQEDATALFVQMADESYLLEGQSLADTYLNIEKIIGIAKEADADAIHPGYGFLSENARFAKACATNNLIFVGPSAASIELMGDKIASRHFAEKAGLPLLKGITGSHDELLAQGDQLDFPVIIKAAAGGGGKGMRIVRTPNEMTDALEATAREAKAYFGDDAVFIEKYIEQPRHIEVQVLGDHHGNIVHLFERECTIQRRHQKIIEEAPSITLSEEIREKITHAAVELARAANYYSAGTVEFIMDEQLNFYFMEMNTRIQVEHPVTELITDVDLVAQQLHIAEGNVLPFTQEHLSIQGHSVEARIYAEDPAHDFRPAPGEVSVYNAPNTPNTRLDTGIVEPQPISGNYDPMISKLVTYGYNREEALDVLGEALEEYTVHGIETNIDYLQAVVGDEQFRKNDISTNYCKTETGRLLNNRKTTQESIAKSAIIAAYLLVDSSTEITDEKQGVWASKKQFKPIGLNSVNINDTAEKLQHILFDEGLLTFHTESGPNQAQLKQFNGTELAFTLHRKPLNAQVFHLSENSALVRMNGHSFEVSRNDVLNPNENYAANDESQGGNHIISPIPGTVIKVLTKENAMIQKGNKLIIVEAMKMENTFTAPFDGVVKKITVQENDKVEAGKILIELQSKEAKND
ncbi:MAG: biotin/lipoyl-binding protein [Saprospiraceae bacterium]|nr:biotin/lipoyl-binding protein [Saprospiraceae bacterium]